MLTYKSVMLQASKTRFQVPANRRMHWRLEGDVYLSGEDGEHLVDTGMGRPLAILFDGRVVIDGAPCVETAQIAANYAIEMGMASGG